MIAVLGALLKWCHLKSHPLQDRCDYLLVNEETEFQTAASKWQRQGFKQGWVCPRSNLFYAQRSASKLTRRGDQHEKKQTLQRWNLIQPNSPQHFNGVWRYHARERSEMINFHNAPKSSSRGQTVFHVLCLERQASAGFKTWLVEWLRVVLTITDMERRSQYVASL